MQIRKVDKLVQTTEVTEGAGVTVHRSIGTPAIRQLDPFLMLDHFGSDEPDQYIAGFPDHPHRGFNTFTYMIDGHMLHQDSMGNKGDLRSAGAQWMKAPGGVIHSAMPQHSERLMRGFQTAINLRANHKMSSPAYQEFSPEAIPVVETEGERVKILLGNYQGTNGPIQDPITHVQYYDVQLDKNRSFHHTLDAALNGFIYVYEGELQIANTTIPEHSLAVLGDGDTVEVTALTFARFILVAGTPIGEPVVQYGPFVMNTQAEIQQAMADYRDGTLVREKADLTVA